MLCAVKFDGPVMWTLRRRLAVIWTTKGRFAVIYRGARFLLRIPFRLFDALIIGIAGVRIIDCPDEVSAGTMHKIRVRVWTGVRSRTVNQVPAFRIRYWFTNDENVRLAGGEVLPGKVVAGSRVGWRDVEASLNMPDTPGACTLHVELLRRGDFLFSAGVHRIDVVHRSPDMVAQRIPALDVTLDITSRCPLRCIMCRKTHMETREVQHDMDFDLFQKIAAEVFPHARSVLLSSAGEPLMSRHFIDAIDIANRYSVPEILFTSSGLHLDPRRARQIVDREVGGVEFSVDGASASVYNGIRVGSDFDRVVRNIRYLAAYKRQKEAARPVIRLNFVLMRRNIDELVPLLDLAADLGAEEILCQHLIVFNDVMKGESLFLDKELANQRLTEAKERAATLGIRFYHPPLFVLDSGEARDGGSELETRPQKLDSLPRCTDPWRKIAFDYLGQVYPCCAWKEVPLGDIRVNTFQEIWNGSRYRRLRETLLTGPLIKSCAECSAITGGDVNNAAAFVF